jgi:hypothetical protein
VEGDYTQRAGAQTEIEGGQLISTREPRRAATPAASR